jgi:branched-chain amino acid transport system permease protein
MPPTKQTKPGSRKSLFAGAGVLAAAILALPFLIRSPYSMHLWVMAGVYVTATLGLYFVIGLCGQFSLAQGAFFAIGAYGVALLQQKLHFPAVAAVAGGAIVATFFGLLIGLPTLRLRGHYLALATIGFGEIVFLTLKNWISFTNGPDGLNVARPFWPGSALAYDRIYYYIVLAIAGAAAFAAWRVRRSYWGRALLSVRDNEIAASAMGVPVTRVKVAAFMASALLGGLAGALYAQVETYISPDTFSFDLSILMVVMLLIGGRNSVPGAVAGAVLLGFLPEWLRFLKDYYMLIFGALVTVMMIIMPQGLAGLVRRFAGRQRERSTAGGAAQSA